MNSYLRRIVNYPQMDFEMSIWEMLNLLIAPKKVYRSVYHYKQTRGSYARADPSFVVLLSSFLCLAAIAWGLAYSGRFLGIIRLMVFMVFVDFVIVGLILSTISWILVQKFLTRRPNSTLERAREDELEWAYCFDIHCNAFLPVFFLIYVVQYFLIPVILRDYWICAFIGNTLYLVAFVDYSYITFLGYKALPILQSQEIFLLPVLLFVGFYLTSLFLSWNIAEHIIRVYFT